jgi:hypothetical protein
MAPHSVSGVVWNGRRTPLAAIKAAKHFGLEFKPGELRKPGADDERKPDSESYRVQRLL